VSINRVDASDLEGSELGEVLPLGRFFKEYNTKSWNCEVRRSAANVFVCIPPGQVPLLWLSADPFLWQVLVSFVANTCHNCTSLRSPKLANT